jgi:hypothetical protein
VPPENLAPSKVTVPSENDAPSKAILPPGSIEHCGGLSPALGGTATVGWLLSFQASCIHWSLDTSKVGQRDGIHEAIP